MRISDLLARKGSAVATVGPGATVRDVVAVLAEKRIGAVVVATDGQHVEGIASERDVAVGLHERGAALLDAAVETVMTTEVHTCAPEDDLVDLARTMTEHRIRHVPVVQDGRLAGIVSIGDVVKARIDDLETQHEALVGYISQ